MSARLSNAELSTVLVLARELCEQLDADDETLLEMRLFRAVERSALLKRSREHRAFHLELA